MKKNVVFYCVCCHRFKEKKWSYEKYNDFLRRVKENKIKVNLTTCNDCKKFDDIFAQRDLFQRKLKKLNKE